MLFMKGMGDDGKGELVDRFSTYEVTTTTTIITITRQLTWLKLWRALARCLVRLWLRG